MKFLVFFLSFLVSALHSYEYLINFQAKVVSSEKHNYTKDSNFNLIKLDGSFTDNLGNYGNWNALVSYEISNNLIKQHFLVQKLFIRMNQKYMFKGHEIVKNLSKEQEHSRLMLPQKK